MPVRTALAHLIFALAAWLAACGPSDESATESDAPAARESALRERIDTWMNDPERLLEYARAAIEKRDFEHAYRSLALIHALHPDSPQDAEAYPVAASLFVRTYVRSRFGDPDSVWLVSEPTFMFGWLATYFGTEFPGKEVSDLIEGVPYDLAADFVAFARTHPSTRDWEIAVSEDNGVVEEIHAQRRLHSD